MASQMFSFEYCPDSQPDLPDVMEPELPDEEKNDDGIVIEKVKNSADEDTEPVYAELIPVKLDAEKNKTVETEEMMNEELTGLAGKTELADIAEVTEGAKVEVKAAPEDPEVTLDDPKTTETGDEPSEKPVTKKKNEIYASTLCFYCEEPGHWVRECSKRVEDKKRNPTIMKCYTCQAPGHFVDSCPLDPLAKRLRKAGFTFLASQVIIQCTYDPEPLVELILAKVEGKELDMVQQGKRLAAAKRGAIAVAKETVKRRKAQNLNL